jgi:hypothetical protein
MDEESLIKLSDPVLVHVFSFLTIRAELTFKEFDDKLTCDTGNFSKLFRSM